MAFDSTQLIDIKRISADGDGTITVAFPDDKQVERRQRARKMFIKDLGRGVTDTEVQTNEDVDLQILNEIKREGPDVDGAEAGAILDRITEVDVIDVVREGPAFRVSLKVPGIVTEHLVRIPTQRQIMEQRRNGTKVLSLPFGRKEVRINFGPSAELYDALCNERTGYAAGSSIPLGHKVAAVNGAITALEREITAESEDPENF